MQMRKTLCIRFVSCEVRRFDRGLNDQNLAPRRAKNTVNQRANVTQWSNYLPQRVEIWIIQRSHLAHQRAKNTVNEQPNT